MRVINKPQTVRNSQKQILEWARNSRNCSRCGGLMVPSFCISPDQGTWDFQIPVGKCLQCGDVVDPTILKNRNLSHLQPSIN